MALRRGALIVLEGCDRAGKSTQCAMLEKALNAGGHVAKLVRFPDRTTQIGQMINGYLTNAVNLDDKVLHLLFSANRWEARAEMVRLLDAGTTLVVDRYAYSGVAFSAAKGLDLGWCKAPDVGLPEPDAIIYLHLSVDDAAKRGDYGAERYEKRDFQEKVQREFERLRDPAWQVLDARQTVEELHAAICRIALATIAAAGDRPLKALWAHETA